MLEVDYTKIQEQGIEFVRVKPIQKDIFEIKSNELRSLFKYKERENYCNWSCIRKENKENSKG